MSALIRIDHTYTAAGACERVKPIRFCSRCGQPSEEPPGRPTHLLRERVCRNCGMGLMLACFRDALPGAAAAFLVVTVELQVSAVSEAAEHIFGLEQDLVGSPLLDLLTSPLGDDRLSGLVGQAAGRPRETEILPVRSRDETGLGVGTMAARISTCGPPRAALVTVEPSDFGRR
jgi:PAS domain-containing protein